MKGRENKRRHPRKYKRIFVRYGVKAPEFGCLALQISVRGCFLSTNLRVYAQDSRIVVEFKTPGGTFLLAGLVRHAYKVSPSMAGFARPGMGVEFLQVPPEFEAWVAAL